MATGPQAQAAQRRVTLRLSVRKGKVKILQQAEFRGALGCVYDEKKGTRVGVVYHGSTGHRAPRWAAERASLPRLTSAHLGCYLLTSGTICSNNSISNP
eukprot:209955-Prorocentrum_minimum.AAC.3